MNFGGTRPCQRRFHVSFVPFFAVLERPNFELDPFFASPSVSLSAGHLILSLQVYFGFKFWPLVRDYTGLSALLGVSQARVAQLVQVTLLDPVIQGQILTGTCRWFRDEVLRDAHQGGWTEQRASL